MSDQDIGRPTQIHNMPWDERAENGGGERLPWAHKSHLSITLLLIDSNETC